MKKNLLVIAGLSLLAINSYSLDNIEPKDVATKVCLALQKMDYQELKKYADEPAIIKIDTNEENKAKTEAHLKLLSEDKREEAQKSYDDKMWRMKSAMSALDCKNIVIMDGIDANNKVAIIDNKPTSLKLINGVWKLTQ